MKPVALVYLNTAAAIASLAGLAAMLLMDRWHATVALVAIILFQGAVLAILYRALSAWVHCSSLVPRILSDAV